jgi:hypothetical protein
VCTDSLVLYEQTVGLSFHGNECKALRVGTILPVWHFVIPPGAGVGGNVFSNFLSSILPPDITVGRCRLTL